MDRATKETDGKMETKITNKQRCSVSQGSRVKRGQIIGRLGNKTMHRKCVWGIRHLHLQLGRKPRKENKDQYWGSMYFLEDGHRG